MERKDRLFVPLAREPFVDFLSNGKLVEIRKYGRNFTEKTVFTGRKVELRLGYSGGGKIWGSIEEVKIASLEEIIGYYGPEITEPQTASIREAVESNKEILGDAEKYIGFKIQFS